MFRLPDSKESANRLVTSAMALASVFLVTHTGCTSNAPTDQGSIDRAVPSSQASADQGSTERGAQSSNAPTDQGSKDTTDPGPNDSADRRHWLYKSENFEGHFENTTGKQWIEKAADGQYNFVEKTRSEKYVELFDESRNITVRLYDDRCEVPTGGKRAFFKLYDGKWVK